MKIGGKDIKEFKCVDELSSAVENEFAELAGKLQNMRDHSIFMLAGCTGFDSSSEHYQAIADTYGSMLKMFRERYGVNPEKKQCCGTDPEKKQ